MLAPALAVVVVILVAASSLFGQESRPTCDSVDFNGDGVFPDTADIDAFRDAMSGAACNGCNDVDFNNDGVFPDQADLQALLRVFAGGTCWEDFDDSGFTLVRSDVPVAYVAAWGSEANDGLTRKTPVRRLVTAVAMKRRGEVSQVRVISDIDMDLEDNGLGVNTSGTTDDPFVIMGEPLADGRRPTIRRTRGGPTFSVQSGGGINHVWIVGLAFQGDGGQARGDSLGIRLYAGGGHDVLIEDCSFTGFELGTMLSGVAPDGYQFDIRMRRCDISLNVPNGTGHSQGLYSELIDGLLLEEVTLYHNGFTTREAGYRGSATDKNHGFYCNATCTNVTTRGCVVVDNSATGLQLRGGVQDSCDNFLAFNPLQLTAGHDVLQYPQQFVTGTFARNVVFGVRNIATNLPRNGYGVCWGKSIGMVIRDNVVAHGPGATDGAYATDRPSQATAFQGNIVGLDYDGPAFKPGGQSNMQPGDVTVLRAAVPTVDDYMAFVGESGGLDRFVELARANRRNRWDRRFTGSALSAWIRAHSGVQ